MNQFTIWFAILIQFFLNPFLYANQHLPVNPPSTKISISVLKPVIAPVKVAPAPVTPIQAPPAPPAPETPPTPTPTPIAQTPTDNSSQTSNYSGSLNDWLVALRTCESGGNYQENTGNGFYGAYQFTIETWNAYNTGYDRADLAPASVQDATIIKNTLASGDGLASQNPGCLRITGISAFPPQ